MSSLLGIECVEPRFKNCVTSLLTTPWGQAGTHIMTRTINTLIARCALLPYQLIRKKITSSQNCIMHLVTISASIFFFTEAQATTIDAKAINTAVIGSIADDSPVEKPKEPDPALVKLQILLDRAGISPGVIDGLDGGNLRKAVAAFETLRGLPADGMIDPQLGEGFTDPIPAIQAYAITADDGRNLVGDIPADYAKQAEMEQLGYTSIAEKLSERFHMDIDLLKSLNRTAAFKPGETIAVAITGDPKTGDVKKIDVHRALGQVFAFAQDGTLLAVYPATIGSVDNPSPKGSHEVKGVARNPPYSYNPKINFQQGENKKALTLPPGPNGPVGTVWIDLTEPTYGIHGTPEPSMIDKAGSHGCVRLTNWDANELAGMVKPGVTVEFVD
jgi:lipoprotein-anchoring transpeptidase ErfK/SrfK